MKALEIRLCIEVDLLMLPKDYERLIKHQSYMYRIEFVDDILLEQPKLIYSEMVATEVEYTALGDK